MSSFVRDSAAVRISGVSVKESNSARRVKLVNIIKSFKIVSFEILKTEVSVRYKCKEYIKAHSQGPFV